MKTGEVLPEGILDLLLEAPAVVASDALRVLSLVGDAAGDEAVDGPVELGEQVERLLPVSGEDAVADGHDARRIEDV